MNRPRVIPVLLLKGRGLVKSVRFRDHRYIGDPLNAARIFNDLRADELILLDIDASGEDRLIPIDLVKMVAEEITMPFSVGGGIRTLDDIRSLLAIGVEKVIIGSYAVKDPEFIKKASDEFGSSSISVCIDVRKNVLRRDRVAILGGRRSTSYEPVEFACLMETNGAGELIVQSVEQDGVMDGYDLPLIRSVSTAVRIPVIALGGAGTENDFAQAFDLGMANGVAAGSFFVYHSKKRGVLINYASPKFI